MKKVLVFALFGLLMMVSASAGNVGTIAPDVGTVQAVMNVQPETNFQVVDLPVVYAGIFLPENTTTVINTFESDAWRNPDWGPSLAMCTTYSESNLKAGNSVQKIPILTLNSNWETRTTHNYNINYSYGLRI